MDKNNILCSKSHEFIYYKDNFYFVGVTDVLCNKIGRIISACFPSVGETYTKGEIFAFLESKSMAAELFMPVTGIIEQINEQFLYNPELFNSSTVQSNWIAKISSEFYNEDINDLICYNDYVGEFI